MSRTTPELDGKVAVVTGAGSGIGRALAIGLARRGARLALSDVNESGLQETVDRVKLLGAQVRADVLDVADRDAVRAYATAVAEHFGVVHQVYNNAGIGAGGTTVLDTDYDKYERVLNVNLWGVIYGTKEFLPHLIASGDGHVVNISSLNGIMGQDSLSGYCTAKFAVRGFTESLRAEMIAGRHPVQVTVVHPGGVKTNIARSARAPFAKGDEHKQLADRFEKLAATTPEKAAEIILRGAHDKKRRVMVGLDAQLMAFAQRLMPEGYPDLFDALEKRMTR